MLRHYVECDYPGIMFPESSSREITNRDDETIEKVIRDREKSCYAMTFYLMEETISESGNKMVSCRLDKSPRVLFGRPFGINDILKLEEKEPDKYRILASNMMSNDYKVLVKCPAGNWQPLRDEERLVFVEVD